MSPTAPFLSRAKERGERTPWEPRTGFSICTFRPRSGQKLADSNNGRGKKSGRKVLIASYRGGIPINYHHLKGLTSVCPNKICCFLPFFRIIDYPANFNLVMFIFKLISYCSEQFLVSVFSESIIYNKFSIKLFFPFRARLVSAQPEMENNVWQVRRPALRLAYLASCML